MGLCRQEAAAGLGAARGGCPPHHPPTRMVTSGQAQSPGTEGASNCAIATLTGGMGCPGGDPLQASEVPSPMGVTPSQHCRTPWHPQG